MNILNSIWDALNAPLFSLGGDPVTVVSILVLVAIVGVTFPLAGRLRNAFERWLGSVSEIEETNLHTIGAHHSLLDCFSWVCTSDSGR